MRPLRHVPAPAALTFLLLMSAAALRAAPPCPPTAATYRATFVTYLEKPDQAASSSDRRCSVVENAAGKTVCRIRMRGILYEPAAPPPPGDRYPAIVYNHGSGRAVKTGTSGRCVADFFVPRGYVVFYPFRRGHGQAKDDSEDNDGTVPANTSTGRYYADLVDQFQADPFGPPPIGAPDCFAAFPDYVAMSECYKAELLRDQSADAVAGFHYLRARPNVDPGAIAFMGSSYGGITSVLVNQQSLGHRAIVAFAAGAQSWATEHYTRRMALRAAAAARQPAFFLQARWDEDTRPSPELALAHAESVADARHGRPFMAAIFDYPKPANDPHTGEPSYGSVHVGFSRAHQLWGVAVLDFLQRNGVR